MKKLQTIGANWTDGAMASVKWGKKPNKRYKGCAGKGGKTTNVVIFTKEDNKDA